MRLVRFLPQRFQSVAREALLFLVIGAVNTVIDYAVLNSLLVIGPLKAKVVATIVATLPAYFMNRRWTYASRDGGRKRREYSIFLVLNLAGLAINLSVIGFAKYVLHYSELNPADRLAFNIANALGIGLAMVFRFVTYRVLVFRTPSQALLAAETAIADGLLPNDALRPTGTPLATAEAAHGPLRAYQAVSQFGEPDLERRARPSTAGARR